MRALRLKRTTSLCGVESSFAVYLSLRPRGVVISTIIYTSPSPRKFPTNRGVGIWIRAAGKWIVTIAPPPGALSIAIVPPERSRTVRATVKPRPLPLVSRAALSRQNRSKACNKPSAVNPGPSSRMQQHTSLPVECPEIHTFPPSRAYLTALCKSDRKTRSMRSRSPATIASVSKFSQTRMDRAVANVAMRCVAAPSLARLSFSLESQVLLCRCVQPGADLRADDRTLAPRHGWTEMLRDPDCQISVSLVRYG